MSGADGHNRVSDVATGTEGPTMAQQALPFDDEADHPIAFSLTARARRKVAPEALPELRVVDPATAGGRPTGPSVSVVPRPTPPDDLPEELDRPGDTRPAQARAMHRAGMTPAEIARHLDVDDLLVQAWIGPVPMASRRTGGRASATVQGTTGSAALRTELAPEPDDPRRAAARAQAAQRLETDPAFAVGLGLVAGMADIDPHAVTMVTDRIEVAATAHRWLTEHAPEGTTPARVILRVAPAVAADLARHQWADALGIPVERVRHTQWRHAASAQAVQAIVRFPDAALAAAVAGWCDALLTASPPGTGGDDRF